jgi:hypothetical protein
VLKMRLLRGLGQEIKKAVFFLLFLGHEPFYSNVTFDCVCVCLAACVCVCVCLYLRVCDPPRVDSSAGGLSVLC